MRIVTVYLGRTIPEYFWANIDYLLSVQDEYPIDIITSHMLETLPISNSRLHNYKYSPNSQISKLLHQLNLDFKFRDGFWLYSLERLFAITQHHQEFGSESLLHIESDVLVLPNFPFSDFAELDKLAWSKVDRLRDVASLIFLPNDLASRWLQSELTRVLQEVSVIDDMAILKIISTQFEPKIFNLPTANSKKSEILNRNLEVKIPSDLHSGFGKFGGIFDPGSIGIWLTGSDPRNNFGVTRKFDSAELRKMNLFIDPGSVRYSFNKNDYLTYLDGLQKVPVFCLHIHSKNMSYFKGQNLGKLKKDVINSSEEKVFRFFSIQIFFSLLLHNLKKGTLFRYLLWLPILQKLKNRYNRIKFK